MTEIIENPKNKPKRPPILAKSQNPFFLSDAKNCIIHNKQLNIEM